MLHLKQIARTISMAVVIFTVISCGHTAAVLYKSDTYTLYSNKIVQGSNVAVIKSPSHITSTYKSTAGTTFPRKISFKFSINEKDMEMAPGKNHEIVIGSEHESPVIKFGQQHISGNITNNIYLPQDYTYTFRADMSEVMNQFAVKGFYTAADGSKIAKTDFKGFYIAGNATPLSWDFVNLGSKNLKMADPDGDNVYEITVQLNPTDPNDKSVKEWKLGRDVSGKPVYTSGQPVVDALFKMSTEEALINIEPDSTFRTGAKWAGVWTRDISYSIVLALAYHQPDVAKISLMKKVKRGRIVQDTGSGGAWPVSSDRTTWALAAWEVYKVTGDKEWLNSSFEIIKNTLDDDYKTVYDAGTGMYKGESSFLDWREQTYPKWMDNVLIYESLNLGTNAVHYKAHRILGSMGRLLGKDVAVYEARAEKIKQGINNYLWQKDKGYYGQYLYGWSSQILSSRFEALGEALTILFDIADEQKAKSIIARSPVTAFGTTCIYPQIPGLPPYHNNAVWPFVQAYWNLAAAKAGNEAVLNHGLASIYRAGGLFLTNYENFVADNGDYVGTEVNSDHMLWSMAGNLAMVHRVFIGMEFTANGIAFNPVVPQAYSGTKKLENFTYRQASLTITVKGYGNKIKSFSLDGVKKNVPFIPGTLLGRHNIEIVLQDNEFTGGINLTHNHFSLTAPQFIVGSNGTGLSWNTVNGAVSYNVYKNSVLAANTKTTGYNYPGNGFEEYMVTAVDNKGFESFASHPVRGYPEGDDVYQLEDFAPKSDKKYTNYAGDGFVELSKTQNREVELTVNAPRDGDYLVSFKYSNGSGPWNTDNKCAIRSLYTNNSYSGVLVMPQRGTGEWSDWGYTNSHKLTLTQGENKLKIVFEDWNNNMNVDVNTAMLDYCRIIKL